MLAILESHKKTQLVLNIRDWKMLINK